MTAAIGVFGKHQGYGDFISHKVDAPLAKWFEDWFDAVLPVMKAQMDTGWDAAWDAAPIVRFWVGRGVAGRTCAGLMVPSRDKVGRRYPLVVMASGAAQAAPVEDADQTLYERIEAAVCGMQDGDDIKDVVSNLAATRAEGDVALAEGPTLWAHHPEGDLSAMLTAAGPEDAKRAITARSYWWIPAPTERASAVWLGVAGLPDTATLAWLLFGPVSQLGGGHV